MRIDPICWSNFLHADVNGCEPQAWVRFELSTRISFENSGRRGETKAKYES